MLSKIIFFLLIISVVLSGCVSKKVIVIGNICPPAHFFAHTNTTLPATPGVWRNITFNQDTIELIVGASHDSTGRLNYSFNITDAGIYKFQYFTSFTDSSPSPIADIAIRVTLNGIEINGSTFEIDSVRQDAEVEGSNAIHARVAAGDSIAFQFISNDADVSLQTHSTFGQHPDSSVVSMLRISCG